MDRVARRGSLARAPGALKSHNAEKLKGGPLRFFNIHSVAKHEKIEENKNFHFRKKSHNAEKKLKGGPFEVFQHPFCRKTWKNWRKQKFSFSEKISQCRKKLKGRALWGGFQHPFGHKTAKKLKGVPLRKKIPKKVSQCGKKLKGRTLWSHPVWYVTRENRKNPFWFSSLGQMVQFGAIIFCRTFKNYFGQFVWIEKKEKPL